MVKVHIVTAGEYSDYCIIAAFSNATVAKEFKDLYNATKAKRSYGQAKVEVWSLDQPKAEWVTTTVRMSRSGEVLETWSNVDASESCFIFDVYDNLVVSVATRDVDRAIKVANEKRTQIIALNLWGNTEEVSKLKG